jgi:Flp pilus assembly protein CpaB
VLQNVQVLSTGTRMDPDPNGKPENVTVVTLLVTPEQSETLALAQNQGTLQFVLRNGGDSENPETPVVDMAGLTGSPKTPTGQPGTSRSKRVVAPVVKPPEPYIVETMANGKITVAKFPVEPE